MTLWELDREWLVVEQDRAPVNCDKWALRPGGYLTAVSAEVESVDGWTSPRSERADLDGILRVKLTNWEESALYGRFMIPFGQGFHKGGVLLPEPLPNFNSAVPYVLHFIDKPPALRIFTVSCWTNPAETMRYRDHAWEAA